MDNSTFLISNYPACYYLSSFILGGRPINSAMYSCPVCLTSFSTKYNRNRHINAQHNPSFQGFKCNCCRKTFTRKSQLSIHKRGRCHGSIPSGEESVVTTCQHAYLPCHKCYGFYTWQTQYQHTACCGKYKPVVERSAIVAERHLLLPLLPE